MYSIFCKKQLKFLLHFFARKRVMAKRILMMSILFTWYIWGSAFDSFCRVKEALGFSLNRKEHCYLNTLKNFDEISKKLQEEERRPSKDFIQIQYETKNGFLEVIVAMQCAHVPGCVRKKIFMPYSQIIADLKQLVLEVTYKSSAIYRRPELLSTVISKVNTFMQNDYINAQLRLSELPYSQVFDLLSMDIEHKYNFDYQIKKEVHFLETLPSKQVKAFICAYQKSKVGAYKREIYLYPIIYSYLGTSDIAKIPYPSKGWADHPELEQHRGWSFVFKKRR